MRLVAAAKVRRAQEAVLQTRPFSETLQSVFLGLIDQLGKENIIEFMSMKGGHMQFFAAKNPEYLSTLLSNLHKYN